jgi:hypothetical protein
MKTSYLKFQIDHDSKEQNINLNVEFCSLLEDLLNCVSLENLLKAGLFFLVLAEQPGPS